jgi:hypothetical protein
VIVVIVVMVTVLGGSVAVSVPGQVGVSVPLYVCEYEVWVLVLEMVPELSVLEDDVEDVLVTVSVGVELVLVLVGLPDGPVVHGIRRVTYVVPQPVGQVDSHTVAV